MTETRKKKVTSIKGQVGALLREARKLQKPKEYVTAYDMVPVINELREKGLTWKEVHAWLHERGFTITQQSIGHAYRKSKARVKR